VLDNLAVICKQGVSRASTAQKYSDIPSSPSPDGGNPAALDDNGLDQAVAAAFAKTRSLSDARLQRLSALILDQYAGSKVGYSALPSPCE